MNTKISLLFPLVVYSTISKSLLGFSEEMMTYKAQVLKLLHSSNLLNLFMWVLSINIYYIRN